MPEQLPRPLWAKAPRSLIDRRWKQTHLLVYLYLDLHAGSRGWWRTTQDVIAAELGFTARSVRTAIIELRDGGLLTTERHGNVRGEITYGIVARAPQETAVPLMPDRKPPSGLFVSERKTGSTRPETSFRSGASRLSIQRSKTSTTEEDTFDQAMKIHRQRAREA